MASDLEEFYAHVYSTYMDVWGDKVNNVSMGCGCYSAWAAVTTMSRGGDSYLLQPGTYMLPPDSRAHILIVEQLRSKPLKQ